VRRCSWAEGSEIYEKYHDEEWGTPVHDDHTLFEFLTLESAQAGLSWITVLRKRENYRKAFAGFDVEKVGPRLLDHYRAAKQHRLALSK